MCDLQIENRQQTELELLRLFPLTGEAKTLFVEKSAQWINLHNLLTPLKRSNTFVWASERSGSPAPLVSGFASLLNVCLSVLRALWIARLLRICVLLGLRADGGGG